MHAQQNAGPCKATEAGSKRAYSSVSAEQGSALQKVQKISGRANTRTQDFRAPVLSTETYGLLWV